MEKSFHAFDSGSETMPFDLASFLPTRPRRLLSSARKSENSLSTRHRVGVADDEEDERPCWRGVTTIEIRKRRTSRSVSLVITAHEGIESDVKGRTLGWRLG